VFRTEQDGWAAFRWDIRQKAQGKTVTGLDGDSTLRELIFVWAPPQDGNNTEAYLSDVLRMTGFNENMRLSEFL